VDGRKTILAPILPHTPVLTHRTQKLHEYLGYDGQPFGTAQGRLFGMQQVVEYQEETQAHRALTYDHSGAVGTWTKNELPPRQALKELAPLFKKLDESVFEEEYARLEG
jgi:methionyl-tRNA synthetase